MKAPYIGYSQELETIDMMKRIKTVFDPKGIMVSGALHLKVLELHLCLLRVVQNPYKYFL